MEMKSIVTRGEFEFYMQFLYNKQDQDGAVADVFYCVLDQNGAAHYGRPYNVYLSQYLHKFWRYRSVYHTFICFEEFLGEVSLWMVAHPVEAVEITAEHPYTWHLDMALRMNSGCGREIYKNHSNSYRLSKANEAGHFREFVSVSNFSSFTSEDGKEVKIPGIPHLDTPDFSDEVVSEMTAMEIGKCLGLTPEFTRLAIALGGNSLNKQFVEYANREFLEPAGTHMDQDEIRVILKRTRERIKFQKSSRRQNLKRDMAVLGIAM